MLSKIITGALSGLEAEVVTVETDFYNGLPSLNMVGLASVTVKEAAERIRAAIINSGHSFPYKRITINFSPAATRKDGSHFDLPIAVGVLTSAGELKERITEKYAFIGELSLDGNVNRIKGALPLVTGLRKNGYKRIILPAANIHEADVVKDVDLYPASHFSQVISHMKTEEGIIRHGNREYDVPKTDYSEDYSDIHGQEHIKRAMEICAAGFHGLLMIGSPGVGKSMMARRLPTIMPSMTYDEMLETTKIYSVAGKLSDNRPLISTRPFRSPYHTISPGALIGGGVKPVPGEISLAHAGVLFLDEFFEFKRRSLDLLRQPVEDGSVSISRHGESVTFPSRSVLVAASNPCPCGYRGDPRHECKCSDHQIQEYVGKLSAPLLDRIDLQVLMGFAAYDDLIDEKNSGRKNYRRKTSADMKRSVENAVARQRERYANEEILYNSQLSSKQIEKFCVLNSESENFMRQAYEKMALSIRGYHKILKVARTIADIEGADSIDVLHLAEALQYRQWEGARVG
ncbi:MAG: YifB family Mg chelatase-like AAA ATPase [Clostridiales bacterium]|nr:YifB family Mg chelatase-like AAA ATPase [Clostridiales bacterium]